MVGLMGPRNVKGPSENLMENLMKNQLLFAALACLTLASCEGPKKNEPPKHTAMNSTTETAPRASAESDQDRRVADAIRQAIAAKPAAQNVVVATRSGVVILHGQVNTPSAKEEIAQIARKIPGVTRVDNQIEVKPGSTN